MEINKESIVGFISSTVEEEKIIVQKINSVVQAHGEVPQNLLTEMNARRSKAIRDLESYVRSHGWPVSAEDQEFTVNTWLVAQHALGLPEVAAFFLQEMEAALRQGLPGWQYAFFYDHYAHRMGRAQRYGTVLQANRNAVIVPHALEDPQQVDVWREELGLPPLAGALQQAQQQFHPETA